MSRILQSASEIEPDPGSEYMQSYREFFGRLRRARIDKGLSLSDMVGEVGLTFKLAYEFENLLVPLPFDWLEPWCKVVGVPLTDYFVVYWDSQQAYFQKLEREAEEKAAHER